MPTSETGRTIAAIARTLPEGTARELREMLRYRLNVPRVNFWREARLGLLVRMLIANPGEHVGVDEYDAMCEADDRDWPSASQLSRYYVGWSAAVAAANTLVGPPQSGRTAGAYKSARGRDDYTRVECLRALVRCHHDLGFWPNYLDYVDWSRVTRRIERQYIKRQAAVPLASAITRRFGTWPQAIDAAKAYLELGITGDSADAA